MWILKLLKRSKKKIAKNQKSDKNQTKSDEIKKPVIKYSCGLTWFETENRQNTIEDIKPTKTINFEAYKGILKSINKELRPEILFYYMKDKTQGGLYKKESYRTIAEYFGVGKDTIGGLFKELKDSKHIKELHELDKYYKLLKEDYFNE